MKRFFTPTFIVYFLLFSIAVGLSASVLDFAIGFNYNNVFPLAAHNLFICAMSIIMYEVCKSRFKSNVKPKA